MAALIRSIANNKLYPPHDAENLSFTNRTIIVTGATSGLGAEAALKFAAQGASRLILAVRNQEKGLKAQRLIQHHSSDEQCRVEVWDLDMSDYDSIRAFAKRCEDELESLDIAVLNAGVWMAEYKQSKYGWEETLQTNTLSTTLLAVLLLPKLQSSKTEVFTPVLEFVSSGRHYRMEFSDPQKNDDSVNVLEDLNKQENFESGKLYRASKLLLMYSMQTLAQLAIPEPSERPDVYVTSVCPGACQSNLSRGLDSFKIQIARYAANALFLRTAEEGSRIFISGTGLGEKGHGQFFQGDVVKEPAATLRGEEGEKLRHKIWSEMMGALAKDVPDFQDPLRARK